MRTAVISCGENNQYGHPAKSVLENVEKVSAGLYRTDETGTVYISVKSAEGYSVDSTK